MTGIEPSGAPPASGAPRRHLRPPRAVVLAAGLLALAASPGSPVRADPAPARDARFGLAHVDNMDLHVQRRSDAPPQAVEHLPSADLADRYRRAADSGAAWHRWSLYWDLADRGGTFDWAVSDGIAARDVAAGLRTLAVLQGMPPGVADLRTAPEGIGAPIFLRPDGTPTDDPEGAAGVNPGNPWARFVAAAVDRYRPGGSLATTMGWGAGVGIRVWEIGNEPNLAFFWRGTPADFARYLEVAYLVAHFRDPAATVLHGGIANDANAEWWFGAFLDALKARAAASPLPARHGYYFDKTAWHWYTVPSNLTVGTPARVRAILSERGIPPKGFWVTEFGAPVWSEYPGPCWDPASPLRVSTAEQAGFVWQSIGEGLALGAEAMVLFQLYDDCGNGLESYDAFGLIRNHEANQCWKPAGQGCWRFDAALAGTPRPAYDAFRVATHEIGAASVIESGAGGGWRRTVLQRAPATRITIAWNVTRQDVGAAIPAAAARARLYDLDDAGRVRSRTIGAEGGRFVVRLPRATNTSGIGGAPLTDGRPVLLVEDGVPLVAASSVPGRDLAVTTDTAAPYLALVRELPATSPMLFELAMVAGDAGSGLAAYQFHYTAGAPPRSAGDWQPVGVVLPWPGTPLIGEVRVPFVGVPGTTYYFAARAADRAGRWTALPAGPQASTRVAAGSAGSGGSGGSVGTSGTPRAKSLRSPAPAARRPGISHE